MKPKYFIILTTLLILIACCDKKQESTDEIDLSKLFLGPTKWDADYVYGGPMKIKFQNGETGQLEIKGMSRITVSKESKDSPWKIDVGDVHDTAYIPQIVGKLFGRERVDSVQKTSIPIDLKNLNRDQLKPTFNEKTGEVIFSYIGTVEKIPQSLMDLKINKIEFSINHFGKVKLPILDFPLKASGSITLHFVDGSKQNLVVEASDKETQIEPFNFFGLFQTGKMKFKNNDDRSSLPKLPDGFKWCGYKGTAPGLGCPTIYLFIMIASDKVCPDPKKIKLEIEDCKYTFEDLPGNR